MCTVNINKLAGPLVYDSHKRGLLLGMGLVSLGIKSLFPLSKNLAQVQREKQEKVRIFFSIEYKIMLYLNK